MNTGLLWYDSDPKRPFAEKVQQAVDYYREKYGRMPTRCFVHPKLLPEGQQIVAGVKVLPNRTIIMHHYWLGVDE